MEWLALIIPIISCLVGFKFFRNMFAWWEYPIPSVATVAVILICKLCVKTSLVSDTEYWGSMVVEARYYEYWETWVEQTCSYTTTCCCDSKGENCQTETHYYDCSYCDHNPAHWVAYDDAGNSWEISEEYYNFLKRKWDVAPQFVNLGRSINHHGGLLGGCGKDGNAYSIRWRGTTQSSEAAVTLHSYVNRVQAAHSSFKLPHISNKEAQALQLYPYPKRYDYYKQNVVLGLDSLYSGAERERIETLFQYFNGYYGHINKVKLFVCLFYNKPISQSFKQEAYWDGGNQNELVVCIGMDKAKTLQWVRAFSWTDRKRVAVDCREDIMQLQTFKPDSVYLAIEHAVSSNVMYKNFKKDFSYLTIDLPGWSYWLIWSLALIATGASWWWCYTNDFTEDN